MKKEFGKYLIDLAKITFASGVIGSILADKTINPLVIFGVCAYLVILFAVLGFYFLNSK